MAGRPSVFTQEIADKICTLLGAGNSLRSICNTHDDVPSIETVRAWLMNNDVFLAQYQRAREYQGDTLFDQVGDVVLDMRSGIVDPQMAKVEIDAIKWQAGRLRPKVYGDKQLIESKNENTNVNIDMPITDADRALLERLGFTGDDN